MPPDVLEFIAPVIVIISIGTFILIGMRMRYKYRVPRQDPEELERITETVDAVVDQTRMLRDDVAELQERLDFHERLLTQPRKQEADTPGDASPPFG